MYFDSGASRSIISTESPIRSVGNGTPLQYIETGKVKNNVEITVVADLKYDLFPSVSAAKQVREYHQHALYISMYFRISLVYSMI